MRQRRILGVAFLCLALATALTAQVVRQTGVIKGVISDNAGAPLPGVNVTADSPALMNTAAAVTDADGAYRLVNLPPGTYTLTASLQGFKTVRQPNIVVLVGQTFTINLKTEASALNEEVTVTAASPVVDVQTTKVGTVLTTELIENLPLGRTMVGVWKTVPGASGTIDTYSGSVHGSFWNTTAYQIDGVSNNDPTHGGMLVKPQYDSMEEMEITTGGLPAQIGNSGGSFVNIVTKSGGNEFHGQAQVYYTNENLTQNLFPKIDLTAMGMGVPVLPKYDLDGSASIGGPIIKNKVWFFGTLGLQKREYYTSFRPPTPADTIINGETYTQYKDPYKETPFFLKVTSQLTKALRFFAMVNGSILNRDVYGGGGSRTAYDATFTLKNNTWVAATGELNWMLGSNTFVNFRGGYTNRWYPITSRDEFRDNRGYVDNYNRYQYNGINSWESYITRRATEGSIRLTHFLDGVLGGNHEIGAGVEYGYNFDRYAYARGNPITQYLYDGSFYTTDGQAYTGTDPVYGDGVINITAMATTKGGSDTTKDLPDARLSAYLQDSYSFKNRLTVNLGLRFDYYRGWFGGGTSTGVSDALALAIGDQLEAGGAGYNPFAAFTFGKIENLVKSTTLSPRIGVSYDLFGNGKTALKLSWGRYYENLPVMWFSAAQPGFGAAYSLYWFDLNDNEELDPTDTYTPVDGYGQFNPPDYDALRAKITDNWETPGNTEWTASITHELFKNFSVKLQYINKTSFNRYWDWAALYNLDLDLFYNNPETAPAGYWVPFTTTVPAYGDFPASTVTVYGMTYDAPWDRLDRKQGNNPDSRRQYNGLELTFDKRYAGNWALGGSVVYSKSKADNPQEANDFTFYGRNYDWYDTPLAIKLYGTIGLPYGFVGSFFYQHAEGNPYARSVSIVFPAAFIADNNLFDSRAWTYLEPIGAHRLPSYDNLDVRLEKEFKFKFGTLGAFIDVFNLLGNKYVDIGRDPGGVWTPETETEITDVDYYYGKVTGVTGVRNYKFSLRFTF
jgi:hypothetical protein